MASLEDLVGAIEAEIELRALNRRNEQAVRGLRRTEVELGSLFGAIAQKVDLVAQRHGVQFSFQPPVPTISVFADPSILQRCLQNLVTISLRFAPTGGLVGLSSQAVEECGEVELTVRDGGSRVDQEEVDRSYRK